MSNMWPPAGWDTAEVTRWRPHEADLLTVQARVEVEGDRLLWGDAYRQSARAGPHLIINFAALADKSPAAIAAFARRWGVLRICEHAVGDRRRLMPTSHSGLSCSPLGLAEHAHQWWYAYDPLDAWYFWARQARAILSIAAALQLEERGKAEDWQAIFGRPPWWKRRVDVERRVLASVLQEWQLLGDVRLRVEWPRTGATMHLAGSGLLGALAVQLLLHAWKRGLAVCHSCATVFTPTRNPRSGQRHYCDRCRANGEDKKDAVRAYYQRNRDELVKKKRVDRAEARRPKGRRKQ